MLSPSYASAAPKHIFCDSGIGGGGSVPAAAWWLAVSGKWEERRHKNDSKTPKVGWVRDDTLGRKVKVDEKENKKLQLKTIARHFLVVQWLGIFLAMQGIPVWFLGQEDPTSCRATNPCTATTEAQAPRACALQKEKPLQREACTLQLEKVRVQQQIPSAAKNKYTNWLFFLIQNAVASMKFLPCVYPQSPPLSHFIRLDWQNPILVKFSALWLCSSAQLDMTRKDTQLWVNMPHCQMGS